MRPALAVAALSLAGLLPWLAPGFLTFQTTLAFIYCLALVGLNFLVGYTGQVSLGHGAFFALGAYATAILTARMGVPWPAAILGAGAICFLVGFLFGFPALRLERAYLALATFALALALPQLLKFRHIAPLTGGVQGIVVEKPSAPFGLALSPDQWMYFVALAFLALGLVASHNLIESRVGRATIAVRDHPLAAQSLGVDIAKIKTRTFAISALAGGVAGALYALTVGFVSPDSFTMFLSLAMLVGVVVGGLAMTTGAIWGGFFIQFVPVFAGQLSQSAPWAVFGLSVILVILVMPRGIAGTLHDLWTPRRSSRARESADA